MKIKRFNESEQVDISSERIEEILDNLKQLSSTLEDKGKFVDSLINELNNYKSNSQKGNDQVDDSVAALQVIKKDLDNSLDKTDTVITNLMDYTEKGRKYLYTENK
jgi:ABC-type transporter Mla subunit MlaD